MHPRALPYMICAGEIASRPSDIRQLRGFLIAEAWNHPDSDRGRSKGVHVRRVVAAVAIAGACAALQVFVCAGSGYGRVAENSVEQGASVYQKEYKGGNAPFDTAAGRAEDVRREGVASLVVTFTGDGVLSMTDPRGRYIWYDRNRGGHVSDIPDALGTHGPLPSLDAAGMVVDAIEIPHAIDGEYLLQNVATGTGDYGLFVVGHDREGDAKGWTAGGLTVAGEETWYRVRFAATPQLLVEVRLVEPDSLQQRLR